jgi:hypothetical protein
MNPQKKQLLSQSPATVLWLLAMALIANAVMMFWMHARADSSGAGNIVSAAAIPMPHPADQHVSGIQVIPTQLSANRWGMILVDTRNDVFSVYRFVGTQSRIELMASRSFRYDLKLKDFNNIAPTPAQVKALVAAGKALTRP